MSKAGMLAVLRELPEVTGGSIRKGWIAISVNSASRAVGLAETIREAGFRTLQRDRVIVFC